MTRVLLCGAGQIGSLHAANLARAEGVSELVVADVDPGRARLLADRVSARAAPEGDPFAVAPDALVVAAATPAHAGLVRQSIQRGIPCFCEKPLSADLDETVELVREVERAGATVQVGFMRRFDPGLRAMRDLIVGRGLGRVHTLHVASHDHEPPSEEYVARSGGMFRDQLIHDPRGRQRRGRPHRGGRLDAERRRQHERAHAAPAARPDRSRGGVSAVHQRV